MNPITILTGERILKGHCEHCGNPIEFYESLAGRKMKCPHCKKTTILNEHFEDETADPAPIAGLKTEDISPIDNRTLAGSEVEDRSSVVTSGFSVLTILAGFFFLFYYQILFNVAVGEFDRTLNIGLLNDRTNGVIIGMGLVIFGGLLMIVGKMR